MESKKDDTQPGFHYRVHQFMMDMENLLVEKNKAYGNSVMEPVHIFSKLSPESQVEVRIDDKLSRIAKGKEYPGDDTVKDLIGYLVIYYLIQHPDQK
jgi:hypothetical protein